MTVGIERSDAAIESATSQLAAPGTYIWVGNHRLHLNCMGEGSPTVIFDSGLGGSSFVVGNAVQIPDAMPENIVPVARSFAASRSSMVAFRSELRHLRNSARQLRGARVQPDVPVVVISHRIERSSTSGESMARARIWMDLQAELARRAPNAKHVIAATEDHYIHLSQPQLVVETIKDVIDRL